MAKTNFLNVGLLRAYAGESLSERELGAIEKVGEQIAHRIRGAPDRRDESAAEEVLRYLILAVEEIRGVAKFLASEGPWDLAEIIVADSGEGALLEGWRRELAFRFSRFLLRAVAEFQQRFHPSSEELASWRTSFSEELPHWTYRWPFDYIRPKAPRDHSREEFIYLDLGAELILVADYLRHLEHHLGYLSKDLPKGGRQAAELIFSDRAKAKSEHPLLVLADDIEELQIKVDSAAGLAENLVYDDWTEEFDSGPRPEARE